jgi:branched-chain amino acid transport system substrate-binding protein
LAHHIRRRTFALGALSAGLSSLLAACTTGNFDFAGFSRGTGPNLSQAGGQGGPAAAPVAGRSIGTGPVQVALLLPLSGDAAIAGVGTAMLNAADLAMAFIAQSPNLSENITLNVFDTGPSAAGATQAATAAVARGVSLILGPLRADQVMAAGQVAKSAAIPLIGFSNNSGAASPGVYLLNVLPETETRRTFGYAKKLGKKAFAGVFPNTDFGRIQEGAFRQSLADLGLGARAFYNFTSEAEARNVVAQLTPLLTSGQVDVLFLPDRATAPSIGNLLVEAGVAAGRMQIIGSADWNNDATIANATSLAGAIFPAVDEAGLSSLSAEYQQKFGSVPHPFATLAYTATILANAAPLSKASPPYAAALLTSTAGFSGRDGIFRFSADGRSEFALAIRQVSVGGTSVAQDAPKKF